MLEEEQQVSKKSFEEILQQDEKKFLCAICKTPTLTCCSLCSEVFYCNEAHQREHWKEHKFQCKGLKQDSINQSSTNSEALQETELSKLKAEKYKLRKVIATYLSEDKQNLCIKPGRKLAFVSARIFEKSPQKEIYSFLTDQMLLVKCLSLQDYVTEAREVLLHSKSLLDSHIDDKKISHKQIKQLISLEKLAELSADDTSLDQSKIYQKKIVVRYELKRRTNLISCMANLFFSVGDFISCEQLYAKYIRLIENNVGKATLDASNCYFLVGVFYLHSKQHAKSLSCFRHSCKVREAILGPNHEAIADCWYNIGILYKSLQRYFKAIQYLNKALTIRQKCIGEISLPSA